MWETAAESQSNSQPADRRGFSDPGGGYSRTPAINSINHGQVQKPPRARTKTPVGSRCGRDDQVIVSNRRWPLGPNLAELGCRRERVCVLCT